MPAKQKSERVGGRMEKSFLNQIAKVMVWNVIVCECVCILLLVITLLHTCMHTNADLMSTESFLNICMLRPNFDHCIIILV